MTRVPLDLLQHIICFFADDDLETFKACSLAIPPLRLDLLKAIFSQLTITFKFDREDHGKQLQDRISSLFDILQVNPSYAKFICNLRIVLSDVRHLHDHALIGSMGVALSECTNVHRLSLIVERRKAENRVRWPIVPPPIRAVVEDMLRSGRLRHLDLQSIALPWIKLLAPGAGTLSLSLEDVEDMLTDVPLPNTRQISHLKTSVSSLSYLVHEDFEDPIPWPMFDFKDLLTLEVGWDMPLKLHNLRKVLSQAKRLRTLSVNMGNSDVSMLQGLFDAPLPPCLSSLESFLCDSSTFHPDGTLFAAFAYKIRHYPCPNHLKSITLVLTFGDISLGEWEGFRGDFVSAFSSGAFPPNNFPLLERFTIIAKTYGEPTSFIWQKMDSLKVEVEGVILPFKFSFHIQKATYAKRRMTRKRN